MSSLLVMDGERLAGIVTDRDLRTRVLAAGVDPGVAVTEVMTADPVTGAVDALAFEVLLEMVGRHIHHLPIVDAAGRPVGIVTTTDLLRLEQANPVYLAGDIAKQPDVAGVARVVEPAAAGGAGPGRAGRLGRRHRPRRHGGRGCRGAARHRPRRGRPRPAAGALLLGGAGLAGPPRAGARGRPGQRDHHRRRDAARARRVVRGARRRG